MAVDAVTYVVTKNPVAYRPPGRLLFQILLLPWLILAVVSPAYSGILLVKHHYLMAIEAFLFALFLLPAFVAMSWIYYAQPLARHFLAKHGATATGTISAKRFWRFARGPKHHLRYVFSDQAGRRWTGGQPVNQPEFAAASEGQEIDIWYWPTWPLLCVAARFCEFTRST